MARRRHVWILRQPGLDPERLIFVEETGASTAATPSRGRCHRSQRLVAATPHGH